jgi:putative transcriptional regulator
VSREDIINIRTGPDGRTVRVLPDGSTEPYAVAEPDWERLDAMTDSDIARQIAENPDAAPDMTEALASPPVRILRRRLGMSQEQFAVAFRIAVGTVRDWEQGRRQPDGPARSLLTIIEREPEAAKRALASG